MCPQLICIIGFGRLEARHAPLGFCCVTIFCKDYAFVRKPLMCSTRWGKYYGLPCCWEAFDVIQVGDHFRRPFEFCPKLDSKLKNGGD